MVGSLWGGNKGRDLLSRNKGTAEPKDCQEATLNLSALDGKLGTEEDRAAPEEENTGL